MLAYFWGRDCLLWLCNPQLKPGHLLSLRDQSPALRLLLVETLKEATLRWDSPASAAQNLSPSPEMLFQTPPQPATFSADVMGRSSCIEVL